MSASTRPFDYLEQLPGTTFNKLYRQPSAALAIFRRMLPDLGEWHARFIPGSADRHSKMLRHGPALHERSRSRGGPGGVDQT